MNLLCPQCQQTIAIADQYAGQLMKCPLCGGTFTAPTLAAASIPSANPTAGLAGDRQKSATPDATGFSGAPSFPPNPSAPVRPLATSPLLPEYRRSSTVWISPRVASWIGPVALFLAFVLTFFNWLWVYDDSTKAAIGKNAWQLAFVHPINSLSLLYLISLLVAVPLGAAILILPRLSIPLPAAIQSIMPWRSAILLAVVTMGFAFLALQLILGFDQEKATAEVLPIYATRTNWLRTCTLLHVTGLVGYALECWLAVRKSKPLPRLDLHW